MTSTHERGLAIEAKVAEHLERAGLEILARNVTLVHAELDIVARERTSSGEVLYVFVEVRSRSDGEHGLPLETIGPNKQRHIIRAATAWLVQHDLWERVPVRFDVVGVTGPHDGSLDALEIEWLRNAFAHEI